MICKECGAYNSDHSSYCKVCAAPLKGDAADTDNSDVVEDSRPTRRFVSPSWTAPKFSKTVKPAVESNNSEEEDDELFENVAAVQKPVRPIEKVTAKHIIPRELTEDDENEEPDLIIEEKPELKEIVEQEDLLTDEEAEPIEDVEPKSREEKALESDAEDQVKDDADDDSEDEDTDVDDNDEDEEEYVPVYQKKQQRRNKIPARRLVDEDDEEDEDEQDLEDADDEDDSYEYEPTPPKRKKKAKSGGPLFWILLIAIIVVILCIVAAGVLMVMQSTGKTLSCGAQEAANIPKTNDTVQEQNQTAQNNAAVNDNNTSVTAEATDPYTVRIDETVNEDGEDCWNFHIIVPAHAVVTMVLPGQNESTYTNSADNTIELQLLLSKSRIYPNEKLTESSYTFTPEFFLTEADGTTTDLKVDSLTANMPTLSIELEKPLADTDGKIMADKNNSVAISGHVDDFDVEVYINDEPVTVYAGGLFMYDYSMTSDTTETIEIRAEKNNYVTATETIQVEPYVFVPDKMILTVTSDKTSDLKADKSGKVTVKGLTLPGATLTAASDSQNVLCGSVSVDEEGNFAFNVTMDASFYGISTITINAEKENAENGSVKCIVFRSYADKDAFVKGYNATKKYKEIGNGGKYLTISELLAQTTTYAVNEYGFRVTAKVAEVIQGEDGYSYVKLTLAGSGEVIYVIDLVGNWNPSANVDKTYNIYGNFLGTYEDTNSALFCGFFARKK